MDTILESMIECLAKGDTIYLPSNFWKELVDKNIKQLESNGMQNMKRTLAQNYFTWVVGWRDEQYRYLLKNTRLKDWPSILKNIFKYDTTSVLTRRQQLGLSLFTKMLWKFAESHDIEHILNQIEEPKQGNPFNITIEGKLISQDLANAALEYYSIREYFNASANAPTVISELGAGYGRNAYFFLQAFPQCKYILIDIPPALYVAQNYITSLFPDRKIFKFRCFDDFDAVKTDFLDADIVFLLPHQANMLPKKCVDLFVNISSLQEMKIEQIKAYFMMIDKLTKGYFYSKQWFTSHNPADAIIVSATDYPIPSTWSQLFHRKSKVQTYFFEAMYKIPLEV